MNNYPLRLPEALMQDARQMAEDRRSVNSFQR